MFSAIGVLSDRLSGMQLHQVSALWLYLVSGIICDVILQVMNSLYPHHLSHFLGMDTHDTLTVDRNTILSPGMVVTIEPGVYIPLNFQCSHTKLAKE